MNNIKYLNNNVRIGWLIRNNKINIDVERKIKEKFWHFYIDRFYLLKTYEFNREISNDFIEHYYNEIYLDLEKEGLL